MTTTTTRRVVSAEDLDGIVAPRSGVVAERRVDVGDRRWSFEQVEGPLQSYRRRVEALPRPGGTFEVVQDVTLRVGVPGFGWLFAPLFRRHTARLGRLRTSPWWAPPARMPRRGALVLAVLCLLSIVIGYLSDLLADTMTYAAGEFRVGKGGQGVALAVVEAGAVGALVLLRVADRRGRRPVLLWALAASSVISALGAFAPSLVSLTVCQLAAASLVGAAFVIVGVIAAEEMPRGCRAWAVGLIGMCFGLGSGLALVALPLADAGPGGWRGVYAISLLGVPAVALCARRLPESRRWALGGRDNPRAGASPDPARPATQPPGPGGRPGRAGSGPPRLSPALRRRLLLLGAGGLLLALFASPASQFQNEFLHTGRHLSATRISLLEQLSGTIGGLGTLIGGRLADTWGRRPVAATGIVVGTGATLACYSSHGVALWVWNTVGSMISYGIGPALGVYGAELFPTWCRARAGGALTVLAAAGGMVGLVVCGWLSTALGGLAPALAVLAAAPLVVVVLIVVAYPETAGRSLEELNGGDSIPDATLTVGVEPVAGAGDPR